MNKKELIDRIVELFSRFRAEVESLNSMNLYDINIHSENVIIPILNKVYGLKLVNANLEEKNYSAVDLIDRENRVAIQVTSTANGEKVKHTLEQYIKYKRNDEFDDLIVYVITSKQATYSDESFQKIIDGKFTFESKKNIYDYTNILSVINSWISLSEIENVLELLDLEFTEEKINQRKFISENKDKIVTEVLYPNILEVVLPETIYVGTLEIDRDEIITQSWQTDYKLKKKATIQKVVSRAFDFYKIPFIRDWNAFGNQIISFRELDNVKEPISKLVEVGSVVPMAIDEFVGISLRNENEFVRLLNNSIKELLHYKEIQFSTKDRLFRFRPPKSLTERKVTWKNKNKATRTVFKEIWNREKTQIICFRQLAFKTQSFRSENNWYVSITPTWSFTYDGYSNHKLESDFITNKKKLETNNAVYQHFMFISYCMSNQIKEDERDYNLLSFKPPFQLDLSFKTDYEH